MQTHTEEPHWSGGQAGALNVEPVPLILRAHAAKSPHPTSTFPYPLSVRISGICTLAPVLSMQIPGQLLHAWPHMSARLRLLPHATHCTGKKSFKIMGLFASGSQLMSYS